MLQFKVKEILEATGKRYPGKWLMFACGMSRPKAYSIINNKQNSINLEDFSKLCENLYCTPNDLMYWKQTASTQVPDDHPCITQLKAPEKNMKWFNVFSQLSPDKMSEVHEFALSKLGKKGDGEK